MLYEADQYTRVIIRPTENENEFSFIIFGQQLDLDSLFASREVLIKFVKDFTNRPELEFGNMKWLSDWRSVQPHLTGSTYLNPS